MSEINQEVVCILCPQGCRIRIRGKQGELTFEDYSCRKGYDYALKEVTNPERMITSSVKVVGGELPLASVRTEKPIPKKKIWQVMKEIKNVEVEAPVEIYDAVIREAGGTDINVIATKKVNKEE
jgi:CxxC motif-containing protein